MTIRNYETQIPFIVTVRLANGKVFDKTVKAHNAWHAMKVARYLVETYQHEKVSGCSHCETVNTH